MTIRWCSDFVAGTLLGSVSGMVMGKRRVREQPDSAKTCRKPVQTLQKAGEDDGKAAPAFAGGRRLSREGLGLSRGEVRLSRAGAGTLRERGRISREPPGFCGRLPAFRGEHWVFRRRQSGFRGNDPGFSGFDTGGGRTPCHGSGYFPAHPQPGAAGADRLRARRWKILADFFPGFLL